ncbi:protein FAM210B, mitochondrial isoform X2 [Hippoglossus hippoglossus]|uniref:protein FAM210B, mitochondrial isoform X2 n=1 Tax=Hippoglossus hippoglossus TaxID=8267 RepID=UPI00148E5EE8|nr:protein FAM210B, mitochondrial isoform X2 [Hippoglossus hippoglossus]
MTQLTEETQHGYTFKLLLPPSSLLRLRVSAHWLWLIIGQQRSGGREAGRRTAACLQLLAGSVRVVNDPLASSDCIKKRDKSSSGTWTTMFWWRAGRLSAAAADQALRSPGCCLVRVNANRLRHVTGTLRKGHTVRCRSVCGSVDSTTHAHLGAQQSEPRPLLSWTLGVADSDRRHWERVAENLFRSVRSEGGSSDVIKPPPVHAKRRHGSGEQPLGRVLFTGTWRVSSRTVHTRASSIAAAAKRSDPGEETGADKRVNLTAQLDCLCNRSDPGLSVSRWRQC